MPRECATVAGIHKYAPRPRKGGFGAVIHILYIV